jgi:hypothetical protein
MFIQIIKASPCVIVCPCIRGACVGGGVFDCTMFEYFSQRILNIIFARNADP